MNRPVLPVAVWRSVAGFCRLLFSLCLLLESQSAGPPGFLLSTAPYTIPVQGKALRKKIPRERSEQGRFFFSKPEGSGLDCSGIM